MACVTGEDVNGKMHRADRNRTEYVHRATALTPTAQNVAHDSCPSSRQSPDLAAGTIQPFRLWSCGCKPGEVSELRTTSTAPPPAAGSSVANWVPRDDTALPTPRPRRKERLGGPPAVPTTTAPAADASCTAAKPRPPASMYKNLGHASFPQGLSGWCR